MPSLPLPPFLLLLRLTWLKMSTLLPRSLSLGSSLSSSTILPLFSTKCSPATGAGSAAIVKRYKAMQRIKTESEKPAES